MTSNKKTRQDFINENRQLRKHNLEMEKVNNKLVAEIARLNCELQESKTIINTLKNELLKTQMELMQNKIKG